MTKSRLQNNLIPTDLMIENSLMLVIRQTKSHHSDGKSDRIGAIFLTNLKKFSVFVTKSAKTSMHIFEAAPNIWQELIFFSFAY